MIKNLALIAFGAAAYATNPDEQKFRLYIENEMKDASWLEKKFTSGVTSLVLERKNFGVFSLIRIGDSPLLYIGAFNHFWCVGNY